VAEQQTLIPTKLIAGVQGTAPFHGARHELTAAAQIIHAGYRSNLDNEDVNSAKRPEVCATHRIAGTRLAFEAKALHRSYVLGHSASGTMPTPTSVRPTAVARRILKKVAESIPKVTAISLVVFVDMNVPHNVESVIHSRLNAELDVNRNEFDPPMNKVGDHVGYAVNLLVVTNTKHHFGELGVPAREPYCYVQKSPVVTHRHPTTERDLLDICEASMTYGAIPQSFEQDL
jgi:hypothetical protein